MKKNKRAILYNPYLDILGGGEKHILSILKVFDEYGIFIDILWNDPEILKKIADRFNLTFKSATIKTNFLKSENFISKFMETGKYDYLFYVTDGSYFFSKARKNYIFSMYPERSLYKKTFLNNLKWSNFEFIANSNFTAKYISRWTLKKSQAIYPYIDIKNDPLTKSKYEKEKIILSVGRFFGHLHSKKHEILIEAFKDLQNLNSEFAKFKLVFVGSLKSDDKDYFKKLLKAAQNEKNIEFKTNLTFNEIQDYYQKAMFYWHAAGYGVDAVKHPELVEHFGISPLEAMAAGALVYCYEAGEMQNIIKRYMNGFLYQNINELVELTNRFFISTNGRIKIANEGSEFVSKNFNYRLFKSKVTKYFQI